MTAAVILTLRQDSFLAIPEGARELIWGFVHVYAYNQAASPPPNGPNFSSFYLADDFYNSYSICLLYCHSMFLEIFHSSHNLLVFVFGGCEMYHITGVRQMHMCFLTFHNAVP